MSWTTGSQKWCSVARVITGSTPHARNLLVSIYLFFFYNEHLTDANYKCTEVLFHCSLGVRNQGRSDGRVYRYLYPPKSAQVNFLWGKNDVRMSVQQFYTPPQKKLLYPPPKRNKFLATPLTEILCICPQKLLLLFVPWQNWEICGMTMDHYSVQNRWNEIFDLMPWVPEICPIFWFSFKWFTSGLHHVQLWFSVKRFSREHVA